MKDSLLFFIFLLLLSGCNNKSNSIPPHSTDTAIELIVEESNPTTNNIASDDIICTAIKNYLLGKSEAAILTPTARENLTESTWPEVQCSVDGELDSPKSFNALTVKKVGNGLYKYECVCPNHGDRFIDYCTIHATLSDDGVVRIERITWDNTNETSDSFTMDKMLKNASWYDTGYGFRMPKFMTPGPNILVEEVPGEYQAWMFDNICIAFWSQLGTWATTDYPEKGSNLTKYTLVSSVSSADDNFYTGTTDNGQIWVMKKKVIDDEEPHVKALVLIYPKDRESSAKVFFDVIRKW